MVKLMAEAPGNELLTFCLVPVSVPVLGADLGIIRPLYQSVLTGNTEAALGALLLAVGLHQGRIHQFQDLLSRIHKDYPA